MSSPITPAQILAPVTDAALPVIAAGAAALLSVLGVALAAAVAKFGAARVLAEFTGKNFASENKLENLPELEPARFGGRIGSDEFFPAIEPDVEWADADQSVSFDVLEADYTAERDRIVAWADTQPVGEDGEFLDTSPDYSDWADEGAEYHDEWR